MAERILPHCIPERAADQHFQYDADHGHGDEISMAAIPIAADDVHVPYRLPVFSYGTDGARFFRILNN